MSEQSGVSDSTHVSGAAQELKPNDAVKYETYSRVLSEAKKLKDKVREYELAMQQSQEQKLKEQNEWKALAEQYKAKLDQTSTALQEQEKSIVNGLKYHEFEKHLGGRLKNRDYASFVDFEKIVLNPETKEVDIDSVKSVTAEFAKKHPELIDFQTTGRLPNQAATGYYGSTKSVSDMKREELEKHILALAAQGKIK